MTDKDNVPKTAHWVLRGHAETTRRAMFIPPLSESASKPGESLAELWHTIQTWVIQSIHNVDLTFQRNPATTLVVASFIFLGPYLFLIPLIIFQAISFLILYTLGLLFTVIAGGNPKSMYDMFCLGPHTPSASFLAFLQSTGAKYNEWTGRSWMLAVLRVAAGAVGAYVVFVLLRDMS
ncbi:hypothetical protein C8J56DRAFT_901611 [Mycena floridula]|nr:hypothetical protein C8J56DRAFT_901611 [Mycena floridula]